MRQRDIHIGETYVIYKWDPYLVRIIEHPRVGDWTVEIITAHERGWPNLNPGDTTTVYSGDISERLTVDEWMQRKREEAEQEEVRKVDAVFGGEHQWERIPCQHSIQSFRSYLEQDAPAMREEVAAG